MTEVSKDIKRVVADIRYIQEQLGITDSNAKVALLQILIETDKQEKPVRLRS